MHTRFSTCELHNCDSHQVWSGTYWPKSNKRERDAPKVHLYSDDFGGNLNTIVNGTSKMDDISLDIAKV